jgi:hypothetical protein
MSPTYHRGVAGVQASRVSELMPQHMLRYACHGALRHTLRHSDDAAHLPVHMIPVHVRQKTQARPHGAASSADSRSGLAGHIDECDQRLTC